MVDTFEFIANTFRHMRWQDYLDIILVSIIIYYAVKFIRDKRAAKLLVGIALILAVYLISGVLEMYAVSFLLTNVFQVGIIALIVIFHPEIRSALEKVGDSPMSRISMISDPKNSQKILETIDIISQAAYDFSAERCGALIVLERATKLDDEIKEGTPIKAELSVKLLTNIFYDKAPLHDGAVIIRNNLIEAAGCILPLSENTELLRNLGTRHRAGLGISERSDAVVVIVSEETGRVSIAVDGVLDRNNNYQSFKNKLTNLMTHNSRKKDRTKKQK